MSTDTLAQATGPDGVLMQSILVARSIPFAKACLAEWHKRDGIDRRDWMRRKSFWVPASVIEPARAALEAEAAK